jgi:hypothetical protein
MMYCLATSVVRFNIIRTNSASFATRLGVTPRNPQSPRDATKHDIQPPN